MLREYVRLFCFVAIVVVATEAFSVRNAAVELAKELKNLERREDVDHYPETDEEKDDLDAAEKLLDELQKMERRNDVDEEPANVDANNAATDVNEITEPDVVADSSSAEIATKGDLLKQLEKHFEDARKDVQRIMSQLKDEGEHLIKQIQGAINKMDAIFDKIINGKVLPSMAVEQGAGVPSAGESGSDTAAQSKRGLWSWLKKAAKKIKSAKEKVQDAAKARAKKLRDWTRERTNKIIQLLKQTLG